MTILIFGAFIFIHELGHYLFARLFDVAIKEFAIGFGPKIASVVSKKTGIRYSLRAFPIGGFVSMVGEEGDEEGEENPRALCRKRPWKRLIIDAAGGAMNLILGFILMTVYVLGLGESYFGSNRIAQFRDNSPSEKCGLMIDDEIYSINGSRTFTANDVVYEVYRNGTEGAKVKVVRDGEKITLEDVVFPTASDSGITYGKCDFSVYRVEKDFGTVVKFSLSQSRLGVKMVWESLIDLIRGRYGMESVSGPIGAGEAIGEAAREGGVELAYLCALITINLGLFNLLPFPALDGCHVLFDLIEMIFRRRPGKRFETALNLFGLFILLSLTVVIGFKDVFMLFK